MDRTLPRATVAAVLLVVVLSGPLVAVVDLSDEPVAQQLGDGTATVSNVTLSAGEVRMTTGRFGTQAYYLRLPEATVDVASYDGRPRLVYRVRVPGLDLDRVETELLTGDSGRTVLRMPDRAFQFEHVDDETYEGTVTVRVQSFERDETVYNRTVRIEIPERP
jgi:hypothetical protein